MPTMTGIEAFLEVLAGAGVRHIFGNPGTTELPLNDALATEPRFTYIFGLHEVPVIGMADGYAMASGGLGVANVHASCGLGNAMGMLYNAHCEGTPLLLTAGQQDRRLELGEPVLVGDLVSVARPWTKWAEEVGRVEDMPVATRRAIQFALSPPTGPVFLALPIDVQMERAEGLDVSPPHLPDRRIRPPREALRRASAMLAEAGRPAILAGSRVTESGAVAALVAVAERLGAPVFSENTTAHGRLPMPADHPLYAGILPFWSPEVRERLAESDVILAVGMNVLRLYIYREPSRPIPEHVRLIHLDSNPWEIGKNYPVEVGLIGDPRSGLEELDEHLAREQTPQRAAEARARRERQSQRREAERAALHTEIEAQRSARPMTPMTLMAALARVLPPNVAVVEEAITTHQNLFERLGVQRDPTGHFAHRGWALGWGLGCALGVKLAWPDRPVVGLLGDGATLYGIQGLWTAAHHRIPVTFVVCNNAQYQILKVCGDVMGLPRRDAGGTPGLDMIGPEVDFVGLARSLGVEAHRVADPDELSQRVRDSLAGDVPRLFEVPIAR
jgi:benzoylformate decarboxylase